MSEELRAKVERAQRWADDAAGQAGKAAGGSPIERAEVYALASIALSLAALARLGLPPVWKLHEEPLPPEQDADGRYTDPRCPRCGSDTCPGRRVTTAQAAAGICTASIASIET